MATTNELNRNIDRQTVVAVFHSQAEAQRAVRELKAAGFSDDEIGVATQHHEDLSSGVAHPDDDNKAGTGAVAGATAGLGAGALWGLGIVAGVLPAIGPVIAGGALAAIAASAAGTAVAGGIVGALVGLGIPEEEAEYYHHELEQGRTVVTVKATGARYQEAHRILDRYNVYDYGRRESEFARNPQATHRLNTAGEMVAREEVLDTHKHTEPAGEARVRKEVTTETQHLEVPVKREELVVERRPMHGQTAGAIGDSSDEERILLQEEKVDVNKRTVAKEAVSVGKRTVTGTQTVDADLKKEHIVVEDDTHRTPNRPR